MLTFSYNRSDHLRVGKFSQKGKNKSRLFNQNQVKVTFYVSKRLRAYKTFNGHLRQFCRTASEKSDAREARRQRLLVFVSPQKKLYSSSISNIKLWARIFHQSFPLIRNKTQHQPLNIYIL